MKRFVSLICLILVSAFVCLGQGSASAHLKGRTVMGSLPKPESSSQMSGKVVVTIKVDQYGNVTEAIPGAEGTNVTEKGLWNAARNAAMKAHFNMAADASKIQTGTITYLFDGTSSPASTALEQELTTLKELVEEKESGVFVVKGIVNKINDYNTLTFLLEQDGYIIPVKFAKKDLGAVNRFRSLDLKRGELLTIKGTLATIDVDFEYYKGLADAVILDREQGSNEVEDPCDESERIPFQLVEHKPSFNGGDANEFSKWVNSRLVYPEIAKKKGIQGRVTLQFTIEADGRVTNVRVLRGVDSSLDAEAVRVVSSSPNWKPGSSRGEAVPVTYTFPVIFQLPNK